MNQLKINHPAVWVAIVMQFVIGFIWYGSLLGNAWMGLVNLTEEMIKFLAEQVLGTTMVEYQGHTFDFAKPFARMTVKEAILKYNPNITEQDINDFEKTKWFQK